MPIKDNTAERGAKRRRGPQVPPEVNEPQSTMAFVQWLTENQAMFKLCTTLGNSMEPILMDICHDALALTSDSVHACNSRFWQLVTLLGGGKQEDGWQRLLRCNPQLMEEVN